MPTSSNKAFTYSKELQQEYGDLQVLNDVVFFEENGSAFVECDGLITASGNALLLNESKTHFQVDDVKSLAGRQLHKDDERSAVEKLEMVIASPSNYRSVPKGIMAIIVGRNVVPVASSFSFSQEVELECHKTGVCMQSRSGTGFATTLPRSKHAPAAMPAQA